MRIISGKYKGLNLVSFKAEHIRPTTDRVKESQFNIIQNSLDGSRVLDLFAGTGNLGIEALSRGAREVFFVEQNRKSIAIIEENIKKLKITEPYKIIARDVIAFLASYTGEPFDVIFADPPFTEKMAHDVMLAAAQSKIWGEGSLLTIESGRKEKIEEDYGTVSRYDVREFGDKYLSFFKLK